MERILALQALSTKSDFNDPMFDSTESVKCSSNTEAKCSTQSVNCGGTTVTFTVGTQGW